MTLSPGQNPPPRVTLSVANYGTGPLTINDTIGTAVGGANFTIAGKEVIAPQRVVQVDRLHYVDQVLEFKPGSEAEPGANRNRNPEAALGDFTCKDREEFVSWADMAR